VIRRCAEHMTSMVESLLDLSRMENGVLRVRSEIVQLPEFLEQIILMMRPAAKAKGLDFIYEAPARLPEYVRTDPHRLRQALINLIGNAIKFTEEGSVTFALRYHGQIASFTISDTGPGIAPEDHQRIFDPYERVAGSDERMRPGVGLGLPITKAIVQILGGNLELESEPGQGACFRVTVMLGEPVGALVVDVPERRITGYEGPARSILLVEDSADQRGFFEQFLASCGFEVVAFPDGESAVALCAAPTFDLAVLDINLPGISGWETAARLRDQLGQDIMIVMASANADEFHRPDYDRPMHDQFLVKPFRLDQMVQVIGALLNISWKWEATGEALAAPGTMTEAAHGTLPPAALPHVERLIERIRIGHVRGIEAEITLLAEAAPDHRELIDKLYAALDKFDLVAMSRLLEGE
jgi:CheY-like chemotaxis protein